MSLKYRDSQGNETPVAGLNGTSGELVPSVSLYQTGSKLSETTSWAPGESGVFSITFATPMPDTSYDVILSIDTPEITVSVAYDKSVNGFKARVENVSSVTYAGRIELYWTAFKLMTDESRALDETHIEQNTANFAPAFSEVTSYAVGDYVTYNNILYRCTTAHTAGVWVAGHFTQVTVGGEVKKQNGVESNVDFNTLTTPGVYSSAGANSPESGYWYTVTVQSCYINGQRYILQFASSTIDTAGMWRRVYNGSTWSAWKKLSPAPDIYTLPPNDTLTVNVSAYTRGIIALYGYAGRIREYSFVYKLFGDNRNVAQDNDYMPNWVGITLSAPDSNGDITITSTNENHVSVVVTGN